MSIGIDVNFHGEYLWFPVAFPQVGKGSVTFEAKAYNNIFVGFSENPFQVRNRSSRMYEIIIGMWDNKTTAIHRKSLGDSVVEFLHKDKPDLSPDPTDFKKYWINIDDGKISGGVGALGQNKLWEWADPYPGAPVKWVGLSNWLSNVTYRNVKVGYSIVTTSKWIPLEGKLPAVTPVAQAIPDAPATTLPTATTATPTDAKKQDTQMTNLPKFANPPVVPVSSDTTSVAVRTQAPAKATTQKAPNPPTNIVPKQTLSSSSAPIVNASQTRYEH
jgi:hypothetical protein